MNWFAGAQRSGRWAQCVYGNTMPKHRRRWNQHFVGDPTRMYTRYCETLGWQVAVASASEGSAGGYKAVQLEITGENVCGKLKFESGSAPRAAYFPTEAKRACIMPAVTVAVLPEADEWRFTLTSRYSYGCVSCVRCGRPARKPCGECRALNPRAHQYYGRMSARAFATQNRNMPWRCWKLKIYETAVRKHEDEIAAQKNPSKHRRPARPR